MPTKSGYRQARAQGSADSQREAWARERGLGHKGWAGGAAAAVGDGVDGWRGRFPAVLRQSLGVAGRHLLAWWLEKPPNSKVQTACIQPEAKPRDLPFYASFADAGKHQLSKPQRGPGVTASATQLALRGHCCVLDAPSNELPAKPYGHSEAIWSEGSAFKQACIRSRNIRCFNHPWAHSKGVWSKRLPSIWSAQEERVAHTDLTNDLTAKAYGRRSLPSTQPAELSLTRIKQQVVFGSDVYCSTWPAQESSIKDQHVLIQINRSQSRIREQLMEVVSLLIK
eukprot:1148542-Pelagomonas_calceolata.AAC.1